MINKGEIILVEEKAELMQKLGRKQLTLQLSEPLEALPEKLHDYRLALSEDGQQLTYTYDVQSDQVAIARLLRELAALDIDYRDLHTTQSSLEEIFVSLVEDKA